MIVFPNAAGYYELPITDDQDFYFEADTSLDESKIKIIEIGFKFFKKNPKFGKLAFVDESYLSKLKIPEDINIAIMINGQDLVNLGDQWKSILENSFKNSLCLPSNVVEYLLHTFIFFVAFGLNDGIFIILIL